MRGHLPLLNPPALRATWKHDFRYGAIPAGATYTGNSGNGTYVNSAGVITASTNNSPRFDFDPATLSPLGYLAEMASTNLFVRSDAFSNASWTKSDVTATADQVVAPDGTTTGDQITEAATNTSHYVNQAITLTADTYCGVSCFFKAGTRSKFYIDFGTGSGHYAAAVFDLSLGTVSQTSTGATSGTIASTSIRAYGNGWYRCGLVCKVANANPTPKIGMCTAGTGNTFQGNGEIIYNGDGTSYGYLWGAQADSAGVGVTSYIPTAGSTVTRAQDVLSLPLTSLPGWSATQGGVLVAAYRLHTINPSTPGYNQETLYLNDGSVNNSVLVAGNNGGSGFRRCFVFSGGGTQIDLGGSTASPTVFTRTKQALGWGTSRGFLAYDGTAVGGTSGALSLPIAPTTLNIGTYGTTALNGTLESIAYYRGARADAFVQAVSR